MKRERCDVAIIGAGVIGLAIGTALLESKPSLKVLVVDKESQLAEHASGRNSGVLHAGFYYSPDSLKARFCRDGNRAIRLIAKENGIPVREVGKVVVARNSEENFRLDALFERGIKNKVDIEIFDESKLKHFEPLAVTHERFIWSPSTAVSDSKAIVKAMQERFLNVGGKIEFGTALKLKVMNGEVVDASGRFNARHYINAAGAQADRISRAIGVGVEYAMLPFMGLYRATQQVNLPLRRLVYPVPHPINPFLGVHFTLTIDDKVKIGPTAIPVLGREQYSVLEGWSGYDIAQAFMGVFSLIRGGIHDFLAMTRSEMPKFFESTLVRESTQLVPLAKQVSSWEKKPPGIRAQLVHLATGRLEQDFVVKNYLNSTHVLNAVSPGWTCAIPFGRYVQSNVNLLL